MCIYIYISVSLYLLSVSVLSDLSLVSSLCGEFFLWSHLSLWSALFAVSSLCGQLSLWSASLVNSLCRVRPFTSGLDGPLHKLSSNGAIPTNTDSDYLCIYRDIYVKRIVCRHICMYIYTYIYIFWEGSPDQGPAKQIPTYSIHTYVYIHYLMYKAAVLHGDDQEIDRNFQSCKQT